MSPDTPSQDQRSNSRLVVAALLLGMFAYAALSAIRGGRDAWQQML